MSNVKCSVSNCKHYTNENCTASQILVEAESGKNKASGAEATLCQTFYKID